MIITLQTPSITKSRAPCAVVVVEASLRAAALSSQSSVFLSSLFFVVVVFGGRSEIHTILSPLFLLLYCAAVASCYNRVCNISTTPLFFFIQTLIKNGLALSFYFFFCTKVALEVVWSNHSDSTGRKKEINNKYQQQQHK